MPFAVALLVLFSALVHASWNAILKRTRDPEHAVVGVSTAAALTAGAVAVALRVPRPPRAALAWCIAAGVLEAGYFVTLARALTRAPLGPVYTIVRGGALVVVWPISVLVLHEKLTPTRIVGTLLVALGLAAAGASERHVEPPPRPSSPASSAGVARAGGRMRGIFYAAICACFVGGYHLAYKVALSTGGQPEVVVALSLSTASLVNIVTLGRTRALRVVEAARTQPLHVAGAGALAALGFVVFLLAMARAGAGVVLTLRNTSILFAQLLALLLGDVPRRLAVIGAVLVTLGAIALAR